MHHQRIPSNQYHTNCHQKFPPSVNNKQLGGHVSTHIRPLANLVRVNLEVVTRLDEHFHLQSVRGIYILAAFNLLLLLDEGQVELSTKSGTFKTKPKAD